MEEKSCVRAQDSTSVSSVSTVVGSSPLIVQTHS